MGCIEKINRKLLSDRHLEYWPHFSAVQAQFSTNKKGYPIHSTKIYIAACYLDDKKCILYIGYISSVHIPTLDNNNNNDNKLTFFKQLWRKLLVTL